MLLPNASCAATCRFEFGVRFAIPGGFSTDPRHPAPVNSIAKTSIPGPGQYEVGLYKLNAV